MVLVNPKVHQLFVPESLSLRDHLDGLDVFKNCKTGAKIFLKHSSFLCQKGMAPAALELNKIGSQSVTIFWTVFTFNLLNCTLRHKYTWYKGKHIFT